MSLQQQVIEVQSEKFDHYFLCNYRPISSGTDGLSRSLLNFKNREEEDLQAWIECSLHELEKVVFGKGCHVLRVLGSNEVITGQVKDTPLDFLGISIEQQFGVDYLPHLLHKSRTTRKLRMLSAADRERELDFVYQFNMPDPSQLISNILLIDDILTTGTTFRSIVKVIRRKLPKCSITFFTLASTDRQSSPNQSVQLSGNSYQWTNSEGWQKVADDAEPLSRKDELKFKILNDSFENLT